MMDYYSDFLGPSREAAIVEIARITGDEEATRQIINTIEKWEFSMTSWMLVKPNIIQKVNDLKKTK